MTAPAAVPAAPALDLAPAADLDLDASGLDLGRYLERIAAPGADALAGPVADAATLRRLHRAHRLAVPFENLDLVRGLGVSLALPDIEAKLVGARRGGYCYEQNLLFAAVLLRLGYRVSGLMGRTLLGSAVPRPRTHMLLRVGLGAGPDGAGPDGGEWLADVGCGSLGPLEPLPLDPGRTVDQDGWTYRIAGTGGPGGELALQIRRGDSWFGLYSFTLQAHHLVDYRVANHFSAGHPDSVFVRDVLVQLPGAAARIALRGRNLVEDLPDGRTVQRELADAGAVRAVLAERFGLEVDLPG
ncbi:MULTISPECIES: arylamine N-acetyltransferase [Kitasatospora]|uniref:Putative arylamine N-acetyltransferase n=1 Tax=Kitasatospora setae (strain ATCC 33774 / DSM 43861 / JCM 3304 / KCC A-0304 / NBRC 14216 / KM-6054) TaxID=452652 RepID=E4N8H0_KITSK|nr:arylamine N-acetyltransferase [Kitasatospora setae]BAJ27501.1 putative arylamine N-acetyltransferase [Kitasatospora setae KM-6054]